MFTIYDFQFYDYFFVAWIILGRKMFHLFVYRNVKLFEKSNKLYVTMTNTFEYQYCILMCKASHYNIIMIYNQKDIVG